MKKFLLCMLVLVMSLALFACGGTGDETTLPTDNDETDPSAHVHAWEEIVELEATCTTPGKKVIKCACGEVQGEEEIPVGAHDATMATCTEDAVCKICGTVLAEKYGHSLSGSIVTKATCVAEGAESGICSLCGETADTVLPIDPNNHTTVLTLGEGTVAYTCKDCGFAETLTEQTPILNMTFDSEADLSQNPDFPFAVKDSMQLVDGALKGVGSYQVNYKPQSIAAAEKLLISCDLQITAAGNPESNESIISFNHVKDNGKTNYGYLIKYFESKKVLTTVGSAETIDETNSVPVEVGKWYKFVAVVDTAECMADIYIDGVYIGSKPFPDHNMNTKFTLRFHGAASEYALPMFDNFKIVEIK